MGNKNFKKATGKWRLLVAADIVVFSFVENKLNVLLIKRKFEPGVGRWAIPGGFVRENESLEQAALRELCEETGLSGHNYLEQLYTFGEVKRDPRGRVISTAYLALINVIEPFDATQGKASDDAVEAKWFPIGKLPPLSFGKAHEEILNYARQRLIWKFEYTNVAFSLLPKKFTLTELQNLYEAVYGRKIDKRNFRKKILSLDLIKPTEKLSSESGRPAQLFQAVSKAIKIFAKIF